MCKPVNKDNGEALVEDTTFQAGIHIFVPQSRSSSRKASILLEQRNFAAKGGNYGVSGLHSEGFCTFEFRK
jgi:hypothetical protein